MHIWSCQFILYSSHINGFLLLLDKNKKFYKGLIIWPWLTCLNTFLTLNISAPATLMLFSPSAWEHLLSLKPQRLYTCHHLSPSCSYLFSPPTPFICLTSSFRPQFRLHSIGDSSISLNLCVLSSPHQVQFLLHKLSSDLSRSVRACISHLLPLCDILPSPPPTNFMKAGATSLFVHHITHNTRVPGMKGAQQIKNMKADNYFFLNICSLILVNKLFR